MTPRGYAGDIESSEAWRLLSETPDAVLIDCRTEAEWDFVGLPDLSGLGKRVFTIEWLDYPEMNVNPDFVAEVRARGIGAEQTLLLICRSGQRSRSAATALTAAGFQACFNVADGFEGPQDSNGHRGRVTGWKVAGLPWVQS